MSWIPNQLSTMAVLVLTGHCRTSTFSGDDVSDFQSGGLVCFTDRIIKLWQRIYTLAFSIRLFLKCVPKFRSVAGEYWVQIKLDMVLT